MKGDLLLGRYRVLELLGSGGFSETYLVRDKHLPQNTFSVVKTLRLPQESQLSLEDVKQLFCREAQFLQELGKYEGLPSLLAFATENDQVYIIEEYIGGSNLEHYPHKGLRMHERAAAQLLQDVLRLLDVVHSKNIIHQDIKPSNLIHQPSGQVALIDFGAAVYVEEAPLRGIAFGTPGYMPVEQTEGRSCFASDFYSLGVTTIQLLTGIHPENIGQDASTGELDFQLVLQDLGVNSKFICILEKMVRMRASERYQSARNAIEDIKAIYEQPNVSRANSWFSSSTRLRSIVRFNFSAKPPGKRFYAVLGGMALFFGVYLFREPVIQSAHAVSQLGQKITSIRPQKVILSLQHDLRVEGNGIFWMDIAPNQVLVTANNSAEIQLWSLQEGKSVKTLAGHSSPLTAVTLSQDGNRLVTAADDREVRVWDLPSGNLVRMFVDNLTPINGLAVSQNNRALATTSEDHNLLVWEIDSGRLLQSIQEKGQRPTSVVAYIPGNLLVCGAEDHSLKLWAIPQGRLANALAGHTQPVRFVKSNPYNKLLYSFGDDRIMVWDVDQKQLISALPRQSAGVISVVFGEKYFITAHTEGVLRLWETQTGRLVETMAQFQGQAVLSPDAQYFVNYTPDRRLKIWRLEFTQGF
jgi:serine/threonine protein kinase